MSWNLTFGLQWREGGSVPRDCRRHAGRELRKCFSRATNLGLVVLEPAEEEPLQGFAQILLRTGSEADFALLLGALQQLAREEPRLLVTASDEFYLQGEDVLTVGEPHAVLSGGSTEGASAYVATPDASLRYHAESPRLDGRAVAASFLRELEDGGLLEWGGAPDAVIERLANLVNRIERRSWQGAEVVLRILEEEDAVAELFATDAQLDELWRRALHTGAA